MPLRDSKYFMKNLTIMLALIISAFTFGQDKGQYTFGIDQNFTTYDRKFGIATLDHFGLDF